MNKIKEQKHSLLSELLSFLKKPKPFFSFSEKSFTKKLKDVMMFWSLGIFVAYLSVLFSSFFLESTGVDDSQNMLQTFFTDYNLFFVVLFVFFWGPISEELTFRLGLKYSPVRLGFSLSFLLFLFLEVTSSLSTQVSDFLQQLSADLNPLSLVMLVLVYYVVAGFLISSILRIKSVNNYFVQIYKKYYPLIFYSSAFLFASIHLFNFANFKDIWLALPFLVAPQLFLGLILSYIRMKYNMRWAIFYHILHNSLASIPILFLSRLSEETLGFINADNTEALMNISLFEKFMILLGMGVGVLILVLFFVFFAMLIQEHHDYKRYRKYVIGS